MPGIATLKKHSIPTKPKRGERKKEQVFINNK
jgi:hypothetical protein